MEQKTALESVVAAWETIPAGFYTPQQIQLWLKGPMWRAINDAREALGQPRTDGESSQEGTDGQ